MSRPSSPESVYLSAEDDNGFDSDQEHFPKSSQQEPPHVVATEPPPLPPSRALLKSVATDGLDTGSRTIRNLLCINAARVLLQELRYRRLAPLEALSSERLLEVIISIGASRRSFEVDTNEVLKLPIFSDSLDSLRVNEERLSYDAILKLTKGVQGEGVCAVITGTNDSVSFINIQPAFVVFNPQCRASINLNAASLQYFPNEESVAKYIFSLLNIHRSPPLPGYSGVRDTYEAYLVTLKPHSMTYLYGKGTSAAYAANVQALEASMMLRSISNQEASLKEDMENLGKSKEIEWGREQKSIQHTTQQLRDIARLEADIADAQAMVSALLGGAEAPGRQQPKSTAQNNPPDDKGPDTFSTWPAFAKTTKATNGQPHGAPTGGQNRSYARAVDKPLTSFAHQPGASRSPDPFMRSTPPTPSSSSQKSPIGSGSMFQGTKEIRNNNHNLNGNPSSPQSPQGQPKQEGKEGKEGNVYGRLFGEATSPEISRKQFNRENMNAKLGPQARMSNGIHSPRSPTGQEYTQRKPTENFSHVRRSINIGENDTDDDDAGSRIMQDEEDEATRRELERMRAEDTRLRGSLGGDRDFYNTRKGNSSRTTGTGDPKGKQREIGNFDFSFVRSNGYRSPTGKESNTILPGKGPEGSRMRQKFDSNHHEEHREHRGEAGVSRSQEPVFQFQQADADEATNREIERIQAQEAEERLSYMYALQLARADAAVQEAPTTPPINPRDHVIGQDANRHVQIIDGRQKGHHMDASTTRPDDQQDMQRRLRGRIPTYDSEDEEGNDEGDKGTQPNQDVLDEATLHEIHRLQAHDEEWEASISLAREWEEEEEEQRRQLDSLKKANKAFDCPVCAEEVHEGFTSKAERCEHVVCRECMVSHIKAQIEAAHWPIFCPMCGPDQANRGVITRHVAELAGGDEELFTNWNRMELGSVSIALECPRCRESARVDAEDFRETDVLDCPLGCGAHWCKNCHREIERNKKHSCDGQEEFDELARDQKWKKCPGCGVMAQKEGGCNQVSCLTPGCNTHFCYICGGVIAKTASQQEMIRAKLQHYQNCQLWA